MNGRMGHAHGHGSATADHRGRLALVLGLTLLVFVAQLVGGLVSGSLALVADAAHMLTDATGVAIALLASTLALRPPTPTRTFGLQRAEILAALANAVLITVLAGWVLWEAWQRWSDPPEVATGLMIAVATGGAVANAVSLLLLRPGSRESLNVRGAYLEVLGDLLGSCAVIAAGVVIALTGWLRADVIASFVIGLLILPRAWALLREVVDVLLEATPAGVDLEEVRRHLEEVEGVVDVHDLHAWTIASGVPVLTAHVTVDDACIDAGRGGPVLDRLQACTAAHFGIEHSTFQLEPTGHRDHEHQPHD
jgi:cobalt-zinc-cadmium efflux system protein